MKERDENSLECIGFAGRWFGHAFHIYSTSGDRNGRWCRRCGVSLATLNEIAKAKAK